MDFGEVNKRLSAGNGIAAVTMLELRNWDGAGRLGTHVVKRIAQALAQAGIRHLPRSLPNSQVKHVILYANQSPAGGILSDLADRR